MRASLTFVLATAILAGMLTQASATTMTGGAGAWRANPARPQPMQVPTTSQSTPQASLNFPNRMQGLQQQNQAALNYPSRFGGLPR